MPQRLRAASAAEGDARDGAPPRAPLRSQRRRGHPSHSNPGLDPGPDPGSTSEPEPEPHPEPHLKQAIRSERSPANAARDQRTGDSARDAAVSSKK